MRVFVLEAIYLYWANAHFLHITIFCCFRVGLSEVTITVQVCGTFAATEGWCFLALAQRPRTRRRSRIVDTPIQESSSSDNAETFSGSIRCAANFGNKDSDFNSLRIFSVTGCSTGYGLCKNIPLYMTHMMIHRLQFVYLTIIVRYINDIYPTRFVKPRWLW